MRKLTKPQIGASAMATMFIVIGVVALAVPIIAAIISFVTGALIIFIWIVLDY